MRVIVSSFKLVVALLLVIAVGAGCKDDSEAGDKKQEFKPTVIVDTVVVGDINASVTLLSTMEPYRQAIITSKVPGRINEIKVDEGDLVKEGDLLAQLDEKDYKIQLKQAYASKSVARAARNQAKAQADNFKADFERFETLLERGSVPEQQFDQVKTGLKAAEAGVRMARAQIRQAGASVLYAKEQLRNTKITAPFDGILARKMMEEGEYVVTMPPSVLFLVMDVSRVKVKGALAEKDASFAEIGKTATVTVDAFTGKLFEGKIMAISPFLDPTSKTITVTVVLENSDHRLKPGMSARITLVNKIENVLSVSSDAVVRDEYLEVNYVFETNGGKVIRKQVETGRRAKDRTEILSGIEPGAKVVISGAANLYDGKEVIVANGNDEPKVKEKPKPVEKKEEAKEIMPPEEKEAEKARVEKKNEEGGTK